MGKALAVRIRVRGGECGCRLADSVNRLRRGQLDPRVANSMAYLTSVLLRALEQGPMEERLAKLEATLRLVQNRQPVNSREMRSSNDDTNPTQTC